ILNGTEKPAGAGEQLQFAQLCFLKKYHVAATLFFRDAFAAHPSLAGNVPSGVRYNAACAAALAGCRQGLDADRWDDGERARWRRQAHDWLREDLAWWVKVIDNGNAQTHGPVRHQMRYWQSDASFAGVRTSAALDRLPVPHLVPD